MGTELSPCCGGDSSYDMMKNAEIDRNRFKQSVNHSNNNKFDCNRIEEVGQYGIRPEFERLLVTF